MHQGAKPPHPPLFPALHAPLSTPGMAGLRMGGSDAVDTSWAKPGMGALARTPE